MSYSRWSISVWYTFWCSTPSDKRDEQLFQICDFRANCYFSYKELKDNEHDLKRYIKDQVIFELSTNSIKLNRSLLKKRDSGQGEPEEDDIIEEPPLTYEEACNAYTEEEYDELVGYVKEFIQDVERDEELTD